MTAGPAQSGTSVGPKVFITYRREETAAHAGRLYDGMVARFGEGNVFMDVDMAPGVDFVNRITEAVAACHVLIVVMGPKWATVADEQGRLRLADPEDFVRLEVETALRRPDVTPIPVLVAGARMPDPDDLPPEVRPITRRQALELSDQRWHYDVSRLIRALDELLEEIGPGARLPEQAGDGAPPAGPKPLSRRLPTVGPVSSRRRLWIGLGVAVVVAALAALAFALLRDGPDDDWARVEVDPSVLGGDGRQEILGMASLSQGRAIAVGTSNDAPAVWTFDGSSWSSSRPSDERGVMWDVVSAGDRIFAVGSTPDDFGQTDAVVWSRSAGGQWQPSVCDDCGGRGRQVAYAGTARSDGSFVAVGNDQGADGTFDAAVWLSSDRGQSWSRVGENDSDLAGPNSQVIKGVAELDGRLVAVGRHGKDAAVWTSTDGLNWSRETDPDLAASTGYLEMQAITRLGTRLVVVGREQPAQGGRFEAAAWVSFDEGSTWRRGSGDFAPRGQQMRDIAAAPPEVVAVGYDGPAAAVWRSSDGATWRRDRGSDLADADDAKMWSVAHMGSGTLLGGGSESGDAVIWESTAR